MNSSLIPGDMKFIANYKFLHDLALASNDPIIRDSEKMINYFFELYSFKFIIVSLRGILADFIGASSGHPNATWVSILR